MSFCYSMEKSFSLLHQRKKEGKKENPRNNGLQKCNLSKLTLAASLEGDREAGDRE